MFELDGQPLTALNGGPHFKFNEAVSFQVLCDTQEEIDYYWEKLSAGGDPKAQQCGWLKDRYGLSWQVVPRIEELFFREEKSPGAGGGLVLRPNASWLWQLEGCRQPERPLGRAQLHIPGPLDVRPDVAFHQVARTASHGLIAPDPRGAAEADVQQRPIGLDPVVQRDGVPAASGAVP